MRKPVQLMDFDGYFHALCDDGTIWMMGSSGWSRIETIPQDEPTVSDLVDALPPVRAFAAYRPPGVTHQLWAVQPGSITVSIDSPAEAVAAQDRGIQMWDCVSATAAERASKEPAYDSKSFCTHRRMISYYIPLPF